MLHQRSGVSWRDIPYNCVHGYADNSLQNIPSKINIRIDNWFVKDVCKLVQTSDISVSFSERLPAAIHLNVPFFLTVRILALKIYIPNCHTESARFPNIFLRSHAAHISEVMHTFVKWHIAGWLFSCLLSLLALRVPSAVVTWLAVSDVSALSCLVCSLSTTLAAICQYLSWWPWNRWRAVPALRSKVHFTVSSRSEACRFLM